ncbi:hypothetical protein D6_0075 [Aeromonas phage D6]|uniref:Uncharacterized protein n=1 Tax=Aeromonas phage D6 TaxID=2593322 RepID=A0A514TW30_9CAUD|nr:hypothetical protein PQC08_gp200 [Aeromonas phage D6]QDJ97235.1 hypothetical protein D6_0075 [Aeromonas phage D6]
MNVDINDIDHVLSCMSGFEAFSNQQDNSDAEYAKSCLKLNGVNLVAIAGNESFFEAIKQGGKKMYEMIVNLLRGIKNFFFGSGGTGKDKAVSQAKTEVNNAKKSIVITVKTLEKGDLPSGSPGVSNTNLNRAKEILEEGKAAAEQINKLMSGENFAQGAEKWTKFVENYTSVMWTAESRAHFVRNIPQVKVSDLAAQTTKLEKGLREVVAAIKDGNKYNHNNAQYIVTTVEGGSKVIDAMDKARSAAKEMLAKVTIDLEHNNKEYKKLLEFTDEVLVNRGKEMQKLSSDLVRVTNNLTALIKDLEESISSLCYGVGRIAKKLGVEFNNPLTSILAK